MWCRPAIRNSNKWCGGNGQTVPMYQCCWVEQAYSWLLSLLFLHSAFRGYTCGSLPLLSRAASPRRESSIEGSIWLYLAGQCHSVALVVGKLAHVCSPQIAQSGVFTRTALRCEPFTAAISDSGSRCCGTNFCRPKSVVSAVFRVLGAELPPEIAVSACYATEHTQHKLVHSQALQIWQLSFLAVVCG